MQKVGDIMLMLC